MAGLQKYIDPRLLLFDTYMCGFNVGVIVMSVSVYAKLR